MPLNCVLKIKIFRVWRVEFIGPFPFSQRKKYILVVIDYASKWVEAIVSATIESRVLLFKKLIFPYFKVPQVLINGNGAHFIEKTWIFVEKV